jgi:hypothetical protein
MSDLASVYTAVNAHLRDNWQSTPIYEGVEPTTEPDPPEPFLKIAVGGQQGQRRSVSTRRALAFVTEATVTLFAPSGLPDELRLSLAGGVERLLSATIITDAAGDKIDIGVASISPPNPADDDNRWRATQITATIRFWANPS